MVEAAATFLKTSQFAELCGISRHSATIALAKALRGKSWHGCKLEVRQGRGRGGSSGSCHEVALHSLPPELQARWRENYDDCGQQAGSSIFAAISAKDFPHLRKAVAEYIVTTGTRGTSARAAAIGQIASALIEASRPTSERTLRTWVATFEGHGLPVCGRKRRADRGQARVIAWRDWDRTMREAGVSNADQQAIAAWIDADVRGLWANGEVSAANIQFSMTVRCRDYAEAAGVKLPPAEMARLCLVPLHYAGEKTRRRARIAHIKRTDAAQWASRYVPRVIRHRDDLRPMDLVAADVRQSDIYYKRDDGSLATAKIVAFQDLATNRIFARIYLLPKGEMIRREHVLLTMRDFAANHSYGLWRGLYLDNGGEFKLGKAPEDMTHLADLVRRLHGDAAEGSSYGNIISRPYNPQSKIIESSFSIFTRSIEPVFPGFVGGNRMAKKTQNQGQAPIPMPGDDVAIQARFAEMVDFYNSKTAQKGHIKGRSPNEAFASFLQDAERPWGAIVLDPREFALAFGPDEWRKVQSGGELHIDKRIMVHPDLVPMVGEKVRVRLPILDHRCAVVLDDKGEPVLVATVLEAIGIRDVAGVRNHDRGRRAASQAVAHAAAGAAKINPVEARAAALACLPPPPPPSPIAMASIHPVLHNEARLERSELVPLPSKRDAERLAGRAARKQLVEALSRAS